jgi:hypothetical protein
MPTLNRRESDGGYFIRHFYHGHSTWQLLGDGVRLLRRRLVTEDGQRFSTDLFMELWRNNLVYYREVHNYDARRIEQTQPPKVRRLRNRAASFYGTVFAGDLEAARDFLVEDITLRAEDVEQTLGEFSARSRQLQLWRWTILEARVYDSRLVDEDSGRRYGLGTTYVRLLADDAEHELKHNWLNHHDEWFLWSGKFNLPGAL